MNNTLRKASFYKLAFKNDLQLTEANGKVDLLGLIKDKLRFWDDIEKHYMSKPGFEDFLQDKHFEENPMHLDDDLPDAFDNWVADLEVEDYERYYDEWKGRTRTPIENIKELKEMTSGGLFESMGLTDREEAQENIDEKINQEYQDNMADDLELND